MPTNKMLSSQTCGAAALPYHGLQLPAPADSRPIQMHCAASLPAAQRTASLRASSLSANSSDSQVTSIQFRNYRSN